MSSAATFPLPAMIPKNQADDSPYFPLIPFFVGGGGGKKPASGATK